MDDYTYVVNVEGAVLRDGEYLLIRRAADEEHASGLLGFPGGKVEQPPGCENSIEDTARRELAEEVGIEVGDVEYVTSKTFESDGGTRCLNVVTRCEHVAGEPTPEDPEEVAAVRWLSVEEIRDHPDAPPFLESYVDQIEAVRNGAHSL